MKSFSVKLRRLVLESINYDSKIFVQAKINFKSQKLIPGMLININLIFNETQSLGVPEQALIIQSTDKFVYKIVDDKIIRTKVTIGKRNYGKIGNFRRTK